MSRVTTVAHCPTTRTRVPGLLLGSVFLDAKDAKGRKGRKGNNELGSRFGQLALALFASFANFACTARQQAAVRSTAAACRGKPRLTLCVPHQKSLKARFYKCMYINWLSRVR